MRDLGLGWLLWMMGCQPAAWPEAELPCDSERPGPGQVLVGPVDCSDQLPPGNDGRTDDWYLANRQLRVIVRHAQDALTLRGVGGLTVVDAAGWDGIDRLHEVVPVVGGGWLEVDPSTIELDPEGMAFEGTVQPIPGLPPPAHLGQRRAARWVMAPDVPWIEIEGAEALWVHAEGDMTLSSGVLYAGGLAYATDGAAVDLGGAVLYEGASRLFVAPLEDIWSLLPGPTRTLSGTAPGASALSLRQEGVEVGRLGLTGPDFDLQIPGFVDGVRAEAGGRAPSETTAPGEGLELELGGRGTLTLDVAWDGRPRDLEVTWQADDGRSARRLMGPSGGSLSLGSGTYEITLQAGPAYEPTEIRVVLAPAETLTLGTRLVPRFDPGDRVAVALDWPSDRSRDWRGSDVTAAELAVGAGYDFVVFTPEDEASGVRVGASMPELAFQSGSLRVGDGWQVSAWPFGGGDKKNLRGGVIGDYPDPRDALAAMWGGPKSKRIVRVDLGWLDAAGAPPSLPNPDFVALSDPPGPDGQDWSVWLDWLDASIAVVPTGPTTWVPVADPERLGVADVEQPLLRGDVCASTGPLLTLTIDGQPPGEIAEVTEPSATVVRRVPERVARITLLGGEDLDTLVLLSTGGEVLARLAIEPDGPTEHVVPVRIEGSWVVALASADDGSAWAVTGPVWTRVP